MNKPSKHNKKLQKRSPKQDFWDDLPDYVKADVEEAKRQSKAGLGIPHAEVMKKYGRV